MPAYRPSVRLPLLGLLVLLTSACGEAETCHAACPGPVYDGGADAADGAFPCQIGVEAYVGGRCVPATNANCGAIGRACPSRQVCATVRADDGGIAQACVAE